MHKKCQDKYDKNNYLLRQLWVYPILINIYIGRIKCVKLYNKQTDISMAKQYSKSYSNKAEGICHYKEGNNYPCPRFMILLQIELGWAKFTKEKNLENEKNKVRETCFSWEWQPRIRYFFEFIPQLRTLVVATWLSRYWIRNCVLLCTHLIVVSITAMR